VFVADFIGVANLMPARVEGVVDGGATARVAGAHVLPFVTGPWRGRPGEAATVMVRPERIRVTAGPLEGGASIPVTVVTSIFQGPLMRLGLRAGDGTEIVAHVGPGDAVEGLAPGATVHASWDRAAARLLPPSEVGAPPGIGEP
jgi:ABC-type Fe3+/spermidine/putrescine transport system ATPase subunit